MTGYVHVCKIRMFTPLLINRTGSLSWKWIEQEKIFDGFQHMIKETENEINRLPFCLLILSELKLPSFKRKVADPAYICTQLAKKILKAQKSNITSLSLTIMWHKIRGKLNILDSVWALYHLIRLQEKLDVISNWNNPSPLCSAICLSHVIVSSVRSDCCFFSVQPGWSASLLAQLGSVSQPSQSRLLGCPNL